MNNQPKPTVHVPVLLDEVLEYAKPEQGGVFVDGTFGGGGYTQALLERGADKVIAIDQDPLAIERGQGLKKQYGDRLILVNDTFSNMAEIVKKEKMEVINGIVLDLGFSSDQLDDAERGLSYQNDGPLDMRMGVQALSAADVVNTFSESDLADIFYKWGEEKKSRQIAHKIIQHRAEKPFERTRELAELVESVVPAWKAGAIHPATRVFQALRIFVNKEMEEVENVLPAASDLLDVNGRLCVVSFHSLEDRVVKNFMKEVAPKKAKNKYAQTVSEAEGVVFENLIPKGLPPSAFEVAKNTRARSAKLRVLERIS